MNLIEFKRELDRLETAFKPLTDDQRDLYFERLKLLSEPLFHELVNHVIDNHTEKTFPRIGQILEATRHVHLSLSGLPDYQGIKCDKCKDSGYVTINNTDSQLSVRPCDCEAGKPVNIGWAEYFKKRRKK